MNNKERLRKLACELYTKDFIEALEAKGMEIPLHTQEQWQQRGYRVKDNQVGHLLSIWIQTKNGKFILKKIRVYKQEEVEFYD